MKFPGTDKIAHHAIVAYYSGKYPDGTHRSNWVKHDPNIGSGYGVVYHRADTVTPNDVVEKMIRQIAWNVANKINKESGYFASDEIEKIIESEASTIRSRYASSDSD